MMQTLYWHDYETWGASPAQDRPAQFAGVRTDMALNIIGEPAMFYCQPSIDCLPHPEACLLTGITPQKALAEGLPENTFFAKVYQELAKPGTCGVGYNSIRFDDEVSRYGFYRNFYDPYEREWLNGNSRWDIIDMVRLCYALRPSGICWPLNDQGHPSFKLEHLSAENGLLHDAAHDALSDVYATIALARLVKENHPQLYDYAFRLRNKREVATLIDIQRHKPLLHISSRFAASHGCAALIMPLLFHPRNKNSVICYDLSVDPTPLLKLSATEIKARLYTKEVDLPEGCARIPLKEVHLNRSPMLVTTKMLDSHAERRLGIDKSLCQKHWRCLSDAAISGKIAQVFQESHFPEKTDPEQQLYDGFIQPEDKALLQTIRQSPPENLVAFAQQLKDARLKTLLFRYRARCYPHTLSDSEQASWQQWCYLRLSDPAGGASITLDDYFERLLDYQQGANVDQNIINALFEYGDNLLAAKD